jgi:hypothetical protein
MRTRIVLVHGAATTSRVWRAVVPLLDDFDVSCPDRESTGGLNAEIAALAAVCEGAGVSDGVAAAYRDGGTPGFAAALYSPVWTPAEAPADPGAAGRDLAMFRAFEPAPPAAGEGPVLGAWAKDWVCLTASSAAKHTQ